MLLLDPPTNAAAAWVLRGLRLGVRPEDDATLSRKIAQVNAGVAVLILAVLSLNLGFLLVGDDGLIRSGLAQLPFLFLAPLAWWLNRRRRLAFARWGLMLLAMADVLAIIAAGPGTLVHVEVYFLLLAVLALMLFPVEQWRAAFSLAALNLLIFGSLVRADIASSAAAASLDPLLRQRLMQGIFISCGVIVGLMTWLTELAAAANERRLQALATTDPLTGVANRRHFLQMLDIEAQRLAREGGKVAVVVFDLDWFKRVNDELGHEAGDQALRHVSCLAQELTRPYDLVARMGGEEFAVLLPRTGVDEAFRVAERFRLALVARPFQHEGGDHGLSVSVGVAAMKPGQDPAAMLREADDALYRAKREGRNRSCVAR